MKKKVDRFGLGIHTTTFKFTRFLEFGIIIDSEPLQLYISIGFFKWLIKIGWFKLS